MDFINDYHAYMPKDTIQQLITSERTFIYMNFFSTCPSATTTSNMMIHRSAIYMYTLYMYLHGNHLHHGHLRKKKQAERKHPHLQNTKAI